MMSKNASRLKPANLSASKHPPQKPKDQPKSTRLKLIETPDCDMEYKFRFLIDLTKSELPKVFAAFDAVVINIEGIEIA